MIRVEFTDREARALSNVTDLMREAFGEDLRCMVKSPAGQAPLETAHLKLVSALEQQEACAV